jgi:nucleotide-binding universal stress UspA family protein
MKTILAPVDLSKASAKVTAAASELAALLRAKLVLLNVSEPPVIMNDAVALDAALTSDLVAQGETIAKRKLTALAARCRNVESVSTAFLRGRPRDVIPAQARKLKADCIVIGTHGHTAAYDLLIGSTTQAVLRRARCPVLVIPIAS